jgi:hypothetical protein
MTFAWTEDDTNLHGVRRVGSGRPIGYVYRHPAGTWWARVGMSGELFKVDGEADGKRRVEEALLQPVEVAAVRHGAVEDPARRNPNIARGLHNERGRVFAAGPSR